MIIIRIAGNERSMLLGNNKVIETQFHSSAFRMLSNQKNTIIRHKSPILCFLSRSTVIQSSTFTPTPMLVISANPITV